MSDNNEKPYDGDAVSDGVTIVSRVTSPWVKSGLKVLVGLTAATAIAYVTAKAVTPEVVTFDMKGTLDVFLQQSAEQKLDEATTKILVARFNRAMSGSLQEWQASHNAIILVKPAVVSHERDITGDIRDEIARRMLMREEGQ